MKAQMKTQTCILCGKDYQPRCAKSYFCLECYLNDYLPNKKKYSIGDFESGCYSLITKRYYERFWGERLGNSNATKQNEISSAVDDKCIKENVVGNVENPHRIEFKKSVSPEHAHKRLVDAICRKTTYI